MWIGICENDLNYRNQLEQELQSLAHPGDRVTSYENGFKLLDDIHSSACPMDLLFLDFDMPLLTGFQTARELRKIFPYTQIVIITHFKKHALKGYQIRPCNFFIKPVTAAQLQTEVEHARRISGEHLGEALQINTKNRVAFVLLKDIVYIECVNHTLHVHTGTDIYEYNHPLGKLHDSLANKGFCRINKSCLVNLSHIKSIELTNKLLLLSSGDFLFISETRLKKVLKDFSDFRNAPKPDPVN